MEVTIYCLCCTMLRIVLNFYCSTTKDLLFSTQHFNLSILISVMLIKRHVVVVTTWLLLLLLLVVVVVVAMLVGGQMN